MSLFKLGHSPELDGLRGVAILAVFFYHAHIPLILGGFIGVDIFFVLSGFLITSLLLQENFKFDSVSLKNFYIRRFLRLMPALLLLLIFFLIFSFVTQPAKNFSKTVKYSALAGLYLSDVARAFNISTMGYLMHTWSLSIEEHFYLLFPPLLIVLLKRFTLRNIALIFLSIIIIISIYRTTTFNPVDKSFHSIVRYYFGFDYRFDEILSGCLLAVICFWKGLPKIHWMITGLAVLFLLICINFMPELSSLHLYILPLLNLATALLLIYALNSKPKFLKNPILVWIGTVSYGLYLWHFVIFQIVANNVSENPYIVLFLGGPISLGITALSFYLLEKPCLKLKERFSSAKTKITELNSPPILAPTIIAPEKTF